MRKILTFLLILIAAFSVKSATITINQENINSVTIQSGNTYFVENCTGNLNLNNVNNVTICSPIGQSKLKGSIELTGNCYNLNLVNLEISGGNICIRIRSYGDNINVVSCKLHDAQYAIWSRGMSGTGFNNQFTVSGSEIYNTLDDGLYIYKSNYLTIRDNNIHHVNMYWKPPSTSQKIAAGDGIQLILCSCVTITGNTIDRSDTGNKFCLIVSGTGGRAGTPRVPNNFFTINNNTFVLPIATDQGGAGLYFGDLFDEDVVDFVFNKVSGGMCAIKFTCLGTFYSNGNVYQTSFGIELQRPTAKGYSIDDWFKDMPNNRRVTSNVQLIGN